MFDFLKSDDPEAARDWRLGLILIALGLLIAYQLHSPTATPGAPTNYGLNVVPQPQTITSSYNDYSSHTCIMAYCPSMR